MLVRSYGKVLQWNPQEPPGEKVIRVIESLAEAQGLKQIVWQRLPNDHHPERRFLVVNWNDVPLDQSRICTANETRFDGVILTKPGQAVAMLTRDCPTLALRGEIGTPVAAMHCSRTSLQGFDIGQRSGSVIANAFEKCWETWDRVTQIKGVITLGIAAKHFSNDWYPETVFSLRERWGKAVVPDLRHMTIDLAALIKVQLNNFAGPLAEDQILLDGLDTFLDERLASVRAGHDGYHNLVIVSRI